MSENWDDYANDWDTNSDVIEYSRLAFESLCEEHNPTDLNVLDFGCGTGLLTEKIAAVASQVLAVDSSLKMIEVLKDKKLANVDALACEISEDTINQNPSLKANVDLIVASSVCSFLPDFEKTLTDLKSLLVPGGIFIQWDWKRTEVESTFGLTEELMNNAYSSAGLSPVRVSTVFSLATHNGTMEVLMGIAKNP